MRRSASEIIRNLESRIARLEKQSSMSIPKALKMVGFRGNFTVDGDDLLFNMSERDFIREFQRAFNTRASNAQEMTAVLKKVTGDYLHFVNPNYHGTPIMGYDDPVYAYN